MASKAIAISVVVLRTLVLLLAVGCVVVLILDKVNDIDGGKVTFKNYIAYRFVLATAAVAAVYSLMQLPFAIYYACTAKRLISGDFLPAFDFYGDKVIAFLVASGVGVGFLATAELKEFHGDIFKLFGANLKDSPFNDFYNKAYIAAALLAGSFLLMAVLSVLSSQKPVSKATSRGFFR